MCNETCTVSIADIYGVEWWDRNKAELDREWEWEFGIKGANDRYAMANPCGIIIGDPTGSADKFPRIILHRRKPKPPTLRAVYGVGEVTIPAGWEWTGEWRVPTIGHFFCTVNGLAEQCVLGLMGGHRLILRERPKKVWFKAGRKASLPQQGDWIWCVNSWIRYDTHHSTGTYLCATRHEEIDQTVQVVTQADVDGVGK